MKVGVFDDRDLTAGSVYKCALEYHKIHGFCFHSVRVVPIFEAKQARVGSDGFLMPV